ncbi:hypothetical protein CI610_03076 [invertebrate metagenome]|uniref:Uncharacterized protein n=1 Tax=invertebrate metagenome TaxID=1711999 RepID=A0A2H9T475_9ZZZZ
MYIILTFGQIQPGERYRPHGPLVNKANWNQFNLLTENIQIDEIYDENVDIFNDNLTRAILDLASVCIPRTSGKPKTRKNNPWWNDECRLAKKLKKNSESKWRANKNNETLKANYVRCKTNFNNIIQNVKRNHWEEFCSSLNNKTDLKNVWSKVKAIQGINRTEIPILGKNNITDKEKADTLAKQYQSASSNDNLTPEFKLNKANNQDNIDDVISNPGPNTGELNCPIYNHRIQQCTSEQEKHISRR